MPISNGQLAWTNRYFNGPEPQPPTEPGPPPLPDKDEPNPYDIEVRRHSKRRKNSIGVGNATPPNRPNKPLSTTPIVPILIPAIPEAESDDDVKKPPPSKRRRRLLWVLLGVLCLCLLLLVLLLPLCFKGILPICQSDVDFATPPATLSKLISGCAGIWKHHFMAFNETTICDGPYNNGTILTRNMNVPLAENLTCCYNYNRTHHNVNPDYGGGWVMCREDCVGVLPTTNPTEFNCTRCFKDDFCKFRSDDGSLKNGSDTCGGFTARSAAPRPAPGTTLVFGVIMLLWAPLSSGL